MTNMGREVSSRQISIGLLGYEYMGRVHVDAYKRIPHTFWPEFIVPRLVAVCGRSEEKVIEVRRRYDFERYYTEWKKLARDADVRVLDNCAPNNMHAGPCIDAAKRGKHVLCEKPLARNAAEAKEMLDAVNETKVKHMVMFVYRFVPAIRLAKNIVNTGVLGRIYHFRAKYLLDTFLDPTSPYVWRFNRNVAGSGVLGDNGSHIIDLARFLVGEPRYVSASLTTFVKERPYPSRTAELGKVEVDDAFGAVVEFENGALGTLEVSKYCLGRPHSASFEINGSGGSIRFDSERLNHLEVCLADDARETRGFRQIVVTQPYHPFGQRPECHVGWDRPFVYAIHHMLHAIVHDREISPDGATFEDGYRNAVVCDAILESGRTGRRIEVQY